MCGIVGTSNNIISIDVFKSAHSEIFYRGPDCQFFVKDKDFVFGHSRLSILDLDERSNQPFFYEFQGNKICVVFNGEIYNFNEIKAILIQKKYVFNTTSDTEVLCAAYLEWGEKCFDYFEGMWATAIYDYSKSHFVISRDRIGKKPFYYSFEDGILNFGSSLWSVCKLIGNYKISAKATELYFALGFTPDTFSIIEGVRKLMPGKVLTFKKEGESLVMLSEYDSSLLSSQVKSTIKKIINKAVTKRTIADVPISTLMSGGVDSTIVTKLIKKNGIEAEAYFVDFDDEKLSENYWASYLSKRNGIKLNRVFLNKENIEEAFMDYPKVYEEPFADYSGIPSIAIFKKVAKNFKVVLTGDGGDELFYGYPHYFKKIILKIAISVNKVFKIENLFSQNVARILKGGINNFESNYLKNHAIVTNFASIYIDNRFNDIIKSEKSFLKSIIQYDREFNNLPEKYLVKTDRASMYSGIEVRSPFLDEILLSEVKKKPVWKLFTPKFSKLYLKLLYFKVFGLKYFFSQKRGFTPPIKSLREKYFKVEDFVLLKEWIKNNHIVLYEMIKDLEYDNLLGDNILFDRFFFFNIWLQNFNNKLNATNKK